MWEEVYNHHAGVDIVGATPADSAGVNLDNLQRHRSPTRIVGSTMSHARMTLPAPISATYGIPVSKLESKTALLSEVDQQLAACPACKLLITGHSLGAAVALLFTTKTGLIEGRAPQPHSNQSKA